MLDGFYTFTIKDVDTKLFKYIISSQKKISILLIKDLFKVIIFEKVVIPNEIPSNAQIFSSHFINEIKDSYIYLTSDFNWNFYIQLPSKKILLLSASFNCIIKAMKLPYSIPEMGNYLFTTYYPYYKKKLKMTESRYNLNLFHKSDYLIIFFFACNSSTYTAQTDLVTKKEKPPKFPLIKMTDT